MSLPLFVPRSAASQPTTAPPSNTRTAAVLGKRAGVYTRRREVAALLSWIAAVLLGLALASYATATPPLVGEASRNWAGAVGDACAFALVSAVGVMAWAIPLELVLMGIPFIRGTMDGQRIVRCAGDLLVLLLAAAMLQVGLPEKKVFGNISLGGAVGELFGELLRSLFSTPGSFVVGFACMGLLFIARASFSFIALVELTERVGRRVARFLHKSFVELSEAWTKARDLERERAAAKKLVAMPLLRRSPREEEAEVEDAEEALAHAAETPGAPAVKSAAKKKKARAKSKDLGDDVGGSDVLLMADREPWEVDPIVIEDAMVEDAPKKRLRAGTPAPPAPDPTPPPPAVVIAGLAAEDELTKAKARAASAAAATKKDGPTIVDTSAALEKEVPKEREKKRKTASRFVLPSVEMLEASKGEVQIVDEAALRRSADKLVQTLANYKVTGTVEEIHPGPVVTTFEVKPVDGTKVSRVAALADDLALALAKKVRIVAPIPGKGRIGFEVPNERRSEVNLRDLIEDRRFMTTDAALPVVMGRDIVGNPVYADLASMPHVIVAGATGAGKSVGLNVMLVSLLFRKTPDELRLLMIDPKVVELAPYDRIPHMLLPVVTDMKQAAVALKWAVDEMERRYQLFADAGTKNVGTYNAFVGKVRRGEIKNPAPRRVMAKDQMGLFEPIAPAEGEVGEQPLPELLPLIVIVVDEFADLMMQQGKEVESAVARLAQKARAAGMHVILATQRPSVDVITGMIKANFPTRIAFRVAQKVDSRTILDEQGAEHLLGKGDMLVRLNGTNDTRRVQCPWVSEEDVQKVTDHLRTQGEPVYDENILKPRDDDEDAADEDDGEQDALYDDAVRIVSETRRCSTSWLQRKLGLGYNRAARIVETMERRGLVGPSNGAKDREVLISAL